MTTPTPPRDGTVDPARLVAAHHAARDFYRRQLLAADGPSRYLAGRGLGVLARGVDEPWHVGYAPPGWTNLVDHLTHAGYNPVELVAAGLATPGRRGGLVDVFRDRIMFPIHNPHGEPVAFIGRAAPGAATDVPKYINTIDTAIYHKRRTLYGLGEQTDRADTGWAPVIVEGPTDVLAIWLAHHDAAAAGVFAVAACGTSLTTEHAAAIIALPGALRHAITTCFDDDPAGHAATDRAWQLLSTHHGLNLQAVTLPAGADPGDLAGPDHANTLRAALTDHARALAEAVIDIQLQQILARHPDALTFIEGRINAVRHLTTIVKDLPHEQIPTMADYIARVTGAGLDLVTQVVIDSLEHQPLAQARSCAPSRPTPTRHAPVVTTPPTRREAAGSPAVAPTPPGQPPPPRQPFPPPGTVASATPAIRPPDPQPGRQQRSR